jgi:hypothetical protein
MKYNFWNILFLVIGGACLGFFGLVYWNLCSTLRQAELAQVQAGERINAIEKFLAPVDDKTNLKQ